MCDENLGVAGHIMKWELHGVLYSMPIRYQMLKLQAREVGLKKALMAGNFGGKVDKLWSECGEAMWGPFIPYRLLGRWKSGV